MARINVKLNADDLQGGSGELHPDGPMRVTVKDVTLKEKNDKTGTYLAWRLDPNDEKAKSKRPVWVNTSLQTGKMAGLKAILDAGQIPYEIASDGTIDFDTDNAIGADLIVNIGHDEYEGTPKNTVKFPYSKVK